MYAPLSRPPPHLVRRGSSEEDRFPPSILTALAIPFPRPACGTHMLHAKIRFGHLPPFPLPLNPRGIARSSRCADRTEIYTFLLCFRILLAHYRRTLWRKLRSEGRLRSKWVVPISADSAYLCAGPRRISPSLSRIDDTLCLTIVYYLCLAVGRVVRGTHMVQIPSGTQRVFATCAREYGWQEILTIGKGKNPAVWASI